MPALLASLLQLSPAIAAAIAALIVSLGHDNALQDLISAIQVSSGEAKVLLLQRLQELFKNAINTPLGASMARELGKGVYALIDEMGQRVGWAMSEAVTATGLPTFANLDEMRAWTEEKGRLARTGVIPRQVYDIYWQHFGAERTRLTNLWGSGAIPAPAGPLRVEYITGETAPIVSSEIAQYIALTGGYASETERTTARLAAEAEAALREAEILETGRVAQPVVVPAAPPVPAAPGVTQITVTPTIAFNPSINVNVPPFPAVQPIVNNYMPTPVVNNYIDTAPIAGGLAALTPALVALSPALAAALVNVAGQLGHGMSAGRNQCLSGTGDALMRLLMPGLQLGGIMAFLNAPDSLRGIVDPITKRLFDSLFTFPELDRPITPEQAPRVAESVFLRAVGLGISAHMASQVSEAFSSLKFMGLPYFAAMLGDMAGFGRVAAATMGIFESQALGLPMKYYVNSKVRTTLPDVGGLQRLAQEYALVPKNVFDRLTMSTDTLNQLDLFNRIEFAKWMPYTGYANEWVDKMYELADRPAGYFLLRAMADGGIWDEQYYIRELANSGYNVATIRKSVEMLRRMTVEREVALLVTEARYDVLDGFIDLDTYQANLTALGKDTSVVSSMAQATERRRYRDWQKKRVGYLLTAAVSRRISAGDFRDALVAIPLTQDRIDMYMEELTLKTRAEPKVDTVSSTEAAIADEIERHVLGGVKSVKNYQRRLSELGYSEREVRDKVELAELKLERAAAGKGGGA